MSDQEVSVDAIESVFDSVDEALDQLGLPEIRPLAEAVSPKTAADAVGFPTPDDLSDDFLDQLESTLGVDIESHE